MKSLSVFACACAMVLCLASAQPLRAAEVEKSYSAVPLTVPKDDDPALEEDAAAPGRSFMPVVTSAAEQPDPAHGAGMPGGRHAPDARKDPGVPATAAGAAHDTAATPGHGMAVETQGSMHGHGMAQKGSYSDRAYLSAMIVHHEAAVEMARTALKNPGDPQVKRWAQDVVSVQEDEIKTMRAMLPALGGEDAESASAMRRDMHGMMAAPATADSDKDFVSMMLEHHAGVMDMALAAVLHSNDERVISLSRGIIVTQLDEMIAYRQWLARHATPTARR